MNLGLVLFSGARQPQCGALRHPQSVWEMLWVWLRCAGSSGLAEVVALVTVTCEGCVVPYISLACDLACRCRHWELPCTQPQQQPHIALVYRPAGLFPLPPSLPLEMFFAKTDCSNDVNPVSLPVPHLSSSLFLFAMLKWRYPASAKVGSAWATFCFLCLPGSRDGNEVLLLGPISPAAAWGSVICGWKSAVLVQFLPEDAPLCLSGS